MKEWRVEITAPINILSFLALNWKNNASISTELCKPFVLNKNCDDYILIVPNCVSAD